jgi:hypothetical protein
MALEALSPQDLADSRTLFASFMGCSGRSRRTVGELLAIYRERRAGLHHAGDPADDLRVERFIRDMSGRRWREHVAIRIGVFDGEALVIDGIHRAIAYLACVEDGVAAERLPALGVEC